jgi:S1-C subfamily serine protease
MAKPPAAGIEDTMSSPPRQPADRNHRTSTRAFLRRPVVAVALVVTLAAFGGGALVRLAWTGGGAAGSAAGSANVFAGQVPTQSGGSSRAASSSSATGTSASSDTIASVASAVDPGLVDINTTLADGQGAAAGTGMVVTSNGEVITNNHVISEATKITATDIGNGKTYTARVIGYDRTDDVAVLALDGATGLTTVNLGNSSTVRVGAGAVTLGNAGGVGGKPSAAGASVTALGASITAGDSLNGTSEQLTDLIGISGDLQPGDSGGPLVNSSGQVIGMDTAASSNFSFQTSAGQGYAIPIDKVLAIAGQIVGGKASNKIHLGASAELGILVYNAAASAQAGYGYGPYGYGSAGQSTTGALVEQVVPGSPAAAAGITGGDTITALGGHSVTSPNALTALMLRHHPGDRVRVTWVDSSGTSHTATVALGTGPSD